MTPDVTVVIPTIGRPSLARAIKSVLAQTLPVAEIIVVADTDAPVAVPDDDRIVLLRNPGTGPARCRQMGIDAARAEVVALLDDDDEWHTDKLTQQLRAVETLTSSMWILSSRSRAIGPGSRRRTWPRRTIRPGESVADYLFRRNSVRTGKTLMQTSTLCFPTELGRSVRWDTHAGAAKDEPSWLIRATRECPDLQVIQLPDVLSTYNLVGVSRSRAKTDRTDKYIDWGLEYLSEESPRILGDYLCTSPISAAVSASSLRGAGRAIRASLRHGRPGPFGLTYAVISWLRIAVRWRPSKLG